MVWNFITWKRCAKKKYNITYALSLNNLFNSRCYYVDSDYINDTLEKLQDIENSKTVEPDIEETK